MRGRPKVRQDRYSSLVDIPPPLRDELGQSLRLARARYPEVRLSEEAFSEHVVAKMALLGEGATLSDLRTNELFLARAAAGRDPQAIAAFERETFREIDAAYAKFSRVPATLDDVKQRLRERLFVGEEPGILAYAGTGALRGWVRAAGLHLLLNMTARETREVPSKDSELFEVVIGDEPSAEAAYVKLACRKELEAALGVAMSALGDRERALLRYAFVDRRTVDDIGAVYGVHRATAARWVAAARARLVEETHRDLTRRLGISDLEAKSIIVAALSGVGSMLIGQLSARSEGRDDGEPSAFANDRGGDDGSR